MGIEVIYNTIKCSETHKTAEQTLDTTNDTIL